MTATGEHRTDPAAVPPVWTQCPRCGSTAAVDDRFADIARQAFPAAEAARPRRLVSHAMLD